MKLAFYSSYMLELQVNPGLSGHKLFQSIEATHFEEDLQKKQYVQAGNLRKKVPTLNENEKAKLPHHQNDDIRLYPSTSVGGSSKNIKKKHLVMCQIDGGEFNINSQRCFIEFKTFILERWTK